jgi:chemotaxis protein CheD
MAMTSSVDLAEQVFVGLGELTVSNNLNVVLAARSLGAGLGIGIYDPVARLGGLLHAALPDSSADPVMAKASPALFVDTGLQSLLRAIERLGAQRSRLQLSAVGGARFQGGQGLFALGQYNFDSLTRQAAELGLKLQAAHVGGTASQSMFLDVGTGQIRVKACGQSRETTLCRTSTPT